MKNRPISSPRLCAVRALDGMGRPGGPAAQAVLDGVLRRASLSPLDRGLATELAYGVLRQGASLDVAADLFLRRPGRTPPAVRQVLRVALYELLHCDRIPPYATVDEATELAGALAGRGARGLVNGVLRAVVRTLEREPDAFSVGRLAGGVGLAAASGIPAWICGLWERAYGAERMRGLVEASRRTPWACLRVNAAGEGAEDLLASLRALPGAAPVGVWGVAFPPGAVPDGIPSMVAGGRVSVQGAGSQGILEDLGLYGEEGDAWDACCGRGGKTFALVERGVRVRVASDVSAGRLAAVRREADRLGVVRPLVVRASAAAPPFGPAFAPALVLVDAPCSGLGTLARRPDVRTARRAEDVPRLAALQKAILEAAWRVLPGGGRLAYVTCTVCPEENEGQVADFLASHGDASLLREVRPRLDGLGSDAMYGAVLAKDGGDR